MTLPEHNSHPQHLKKIGEKVLKHMSIVVKDKFWFSRDGAFYVHPRNRKNVLDWQKIKVEIEGEDPHDPQEKRASQEKVEKKFTSKDKGKGKQVPQEQKKRKFSLRT